MEREMLICTPYFYPDIGVVCSQFPLAFQCCGGGGYYIYEPNQYNLIRQLELHSTCVYVVGIYTI